MVSNNPAIWYFGIFVVFGIIFQDIYQKFSQWFEIMIGLNIL